MNIISRPRRKGQHEQISPHQAKTIHKTANYIRKQITAQLKAQANTQLILLRINTTEFAYNKLIVTDRHNNSQSLTSVRRLLPKSRKISTSPLICASQ